MKIGNTDFNADAIKAMTFEEFSEAAKHYKGDVPLKEVYQKLGGKIKTKPQYEPMEGHDVREAN